MWEIRIEHPQLHKFRVIRGADKFIVEQKAQVQMAAWEEAWLAKSQKLAKAEHLQTKIAEAEQQTKSASEEIRKLQSILVHTLAVNDAIDWDSLKDTASFDEPEPLRPEMQNVPPEPSPEDPKYRAHLGIFGRVFSTIRERRIADAQNEYDSDTAAWKTLKGMIIKHNADSQHAFEEAFQVWRSRQAAHRERCAKTNELIKKRKQQYLDKDPGAVLDYCELVLSNSDYPDCFPKDYDLEYRHESKVIVVDYTLPSIDDMPKVKEVRYVKSRDELVEVLLPTSARAALYDSMLYQTALRTIHELYEADVVGALEMVVFNGWVESCDRATGKLASACILSVQAENAEFQGIKLDAIDPKTCFKGLKGIGSSKLHSLTPIAPILTISREDRRFIAAYAVAGELNESSNLAAMDWQDFEHLIRELFEKEFSQSGGEVRVTQASRDGGVDAVAFDPDPIRGGKIVIQAKRFTNTVGVSAVRDLYGTVLNEGATKGILVTTADYGPDAYAFAKGKPLTLLNGGNLLHLLEKHGHRATIDLKAARQILADREKEP